ncbi:MAG: efflux RND transporter permease subunit [Pirellulales bacterium]
MTTPTPDRDTPSATAPPCHSPNHAGPGLHPLSKLVSIFLESNLSLILIVFSMLVGVAALIVTPREEDPQIVVPLADVFVRFPGHSAEEVEQLVAAPLERFLYQIDGVEYVYSMSREDEAIITVRFYVGQDRERSLVKLFKKLGESADQVPPGVTGWLLKPVEIDDVPLVTLTLTGAGQDTHRLRRVAEELMERLAVLPQVSRSYVVGGEPRRVQVAWDADRLQAYGLALLDAEEALRAANLSRAVGDAALGDRVRTIAAGRVWTRPEELRELVVGVAHGQPVFLRDVAEVRDGAAEVVSRVRHGWGPGREFVEGAEAPGTILGVATSKFAPTVEKTAAAEGMATAGDEPAVPAVTLAVAKQRGANAVAVAHAVLAEADRLRQELVPDDVQLIVTRNNGRTANDKVNELVEALGVAIVIVILLLTLSLGWREAVVVAVAVPVVFGLTLAVNLIAGYTINRVTLFALILSLGLLVDDPIVDVENIVRHFAERRRASRGIVLDAVAEIRPPLISATLAVIVSFLPMFFITGMMGPYMSPMALNVPVAMFMSLLVAFTITPWLSYHLLRHGYPSGEAPAGEDATSGPVGDHGFYDPDVVRQSLLYRLFRPLMLPLLQTRARAWGFLALVGGLTVAAAGLAALRWVPLKMLPFDNKNEFLVVVDFAAGTTLERSAAALGDFERVLAAEPEVTDFTTYLGTPGPIDFNGLVRHYYLRRSPHLAEIRVNLVGKKHRRMQSHALTLRLRAALTELGERHDAVVRLVELPPGPPVLAALVAEVYGPADQTYEQLLNAADRVAERLRREPGVVEVDDLREEPVERWVFVTDQEKAALAGVTPAQLAQTLRDAVSGADDSLLHVPHERQPLPIEMRLPRAARARPSDLGAMAVRGRTGELVPVAELGRWELRRVDQTIYHKNLRRVAYVMAESVGRAPAECLADILADRQTDGGPTTPAGPPRPVAARTYFSNGGGSPWSMPAGYRVRWDGEGEWNITLDVFRDLGLAFGAALLMIYIILVAQTGSFTIPLLVMLAIPLTLLGVMPGFYLLNQLGGGPVGGYADPVYFTATAMIGMIALSGIVTRDSIILVDFLEMAVRRGRPLFDAILESRVVRLRPILLTAGAALLSSLPITLDPIFAGLGWSLIFGLVASTVFTLFVIPVGYWLMRGGRHP